LDHIDGIGFRRLHIEMEEESGRGVEEEEEIGTQIIWK